jgi:hypothetical protein
MREKMNPNQEFNEAGMPLKAFIEYYNRTIPADFTHATEKAMKKFKADRTALFDGDGLWSLDKHRKHVMDFLRSYREIEE